MGKKFDPDDNEMYKSTDEVLHYIWDPIGVAGSPYARDEYWSYLPNVFNLVKEHKSKSEIVNYLKSVEEHMGLTHNKKKAEETVEILFEYRKKIYEENT